MTEGLYYPSGRQSEQISPPSASSDSPQDNSADTHGFVRGCSNMAVTLIENHEDRKLDPVVRELRHEQKKSRIKEIQSCLLSPSQVA